MLYGMWIVAHMYTTSIMSFCSSTQDRFYLMKLKLFYLSYLMKVTIECKEKSYDGNSNKDYDYGPSIEGSSLVWK